MSDSLTLSGSDWKSILRGALVNLGGTALLTIGMWLGSISPEGTFNWYALKIALATNLGAILVNVSRKFLGTQ